VPQREQPTSTERGRAAESAVAAYLISRGYTLLTSNYRVSRLGELDLVMSHHPASDSAEADRSAQSMSILTVVEVKARRDSMHYGGAVAALTSAKLRRIRQTTLHFQQKYHFLNNPVELLAALVHLDKHGTVQNIEIIPIEWQ
jgi:Holliday junction resolvase-like predicted endonuclease